MTPFAELDALCSRVLNDYAEMCPGILSSSTEGNKEAIQWDLLDMRSQLLEEGKKLDGKKLAPRKRLITIEEADCDE